ncbi:MAG: carboxypeptidase-like regulatory domain-containing protein [Acidobacteriia bacterium]|nr:carboxypeptidase-like regulatory domain-containing protein [Terriglobia bacterium]
MARKYFAKMLLALAAILLLTMQLVASLDRGAIRGTVTDPQGGVVPGAKVVVRNVDTGVVANLVTNAAGVYLATDLVPGKYTIRLEAPGFRVFEISNVVVTANTTLTEDAQLAVGPATQSIEVHAQAELAQTTASNFSTGISQRYMENLPLQGRDIQTLVSLFPGVIQSSGPSGAVFGSNSQFGGFPDPLHLVGSSVSANGGQAGANAWFLEGALNATVGAEAATVNPSPDAVQEFNLVQNSLAAEYGRTSGMVVNVVLKSGTNQLHGSGSILNRNSVFSATNPFSRRTTPGEPDIQPWTNWNDFSGTLGGPVVIPHLYNGKNRTFFFVSEDVSTLHERQNKILTVPMPAEKNGDFAGNPYYTATCDTVNNPSACLYDPATTTLDSATGAYTRTPFTTPVIPPNRIDPLAKFYLDSIPAPNYVDPLSPCSPAYLCNNYLGAVGSSMTTHNASVKIDHNISDKHRLFVSWLFNPSYYENYRYPWNGPSAQVGTGILGPNPFRTRNQLAIVGLTSTLTPTIVNEVRFSFGRQNLVSLPNPDSVTATQQIKQKVAGLNFWLYDPLQSVPTISFWNNEANSYFQMGYVGYTDVTIGQQAWTFNDSLTKIWGRHTIKGGFTFRRNNLWGSSAAGYNITFDGYHTEDPVNPYGGPNWNGLADFLLGSVPQGVGSSAIQLSPWQTNDDYAAYVQDDFRATKNFTVSLGVRWDVYGWIRERHNQLANFDLSLKNPDVNALGKLVYPGTPSHPDRNLFPANKGSFGPRIGFAWSPFGNNKTVIRGGYGLIYSNSLSAAFGQGNGAFSTMGSYVPVSTPINDPLYSAAYYQTGGWTLSQGAPSIQFPDLTANRKNDFQYVGVSSANIYGFIKGDKDPYIQQWNFSIQRELPGNILISAAYVGSHGSHLLEDEFRNTNQVPKSAYARVRSHINDYTYQVDPSFNGLWNDCGQWNQPADNNVYCSGWYALEPYPFWWSVQSLLTPDGISKYHSGQLRVEKRYSQGLNFIAAYTYSKNIVSAGLGALVGNTIGPTTLGGRGVGRIAWVPGSSMGGAADFFTHTTADDVYNLRRYDALSPDDTPHVFNIASTYELPFGRGKKWMNSSRAANAIFGGWKFTQIWNFQSGVPMFFTTQSACTGLYKVISCRPNVVGNLSAGRSSKSKVQREQQWYNAGALCAPWGCGDALTTTIYNAYNAGDNATLDSIDSFWQLGNAGTRPPSGRIPGYWNADMSLAKEFRVWENKYLNFRWDVFNALNHQNLGVPNSTWCLPPGPNGELDYVHTFGCSFGQITNVQTDPREMQFSLKFYW